MINFMTKYIPKKSFSQFFNRKSGHCKLTFLYYKNNFLLNFFDKSHYKLELEFFAWSS